VIKKVRNPEFDQLHSIFPVSHETFERLIIYKNLVLKWQKSVNLISLNTIPEIWSRHFLDSVQIAPLLGNNNSTVIDLGSGAGFPGMLMAIVGWNNVHLVESDKKKCIFLNEVSRETNTPIIIHNDRVENLSFRSDIILSRACASVSQLLDWSEKIVSHETKCFFHKGKNHSIECEMAKKDWMFEVKFHPSITEKDAAILELSDVYRRSK